MAVKKWGTAVIILILLIGGGSWYFVKAKQKNTPVMAAVQTGMVQKGNLNVTVSGSGSVESASSEDVKASTSAEVDEVLVSENETVKKGEDLVTFTDGSDPITAPVSGTVTSLSVTSGQRINAGSTVAHVTNYKDLQTTIKVDELDIPQVKNGQTATVKANAYPNDTFTGKVSSIAREGDVSNGVSTFNVTVHITDPKQLKVGMTTEANILTASKKNILYVPVDAVHTNGNQKFVIISNGNSQNSQVVKTGIHNDSYVEITSGLNEGEQVQLPAVAKSSSNGTTYRRGFGMNGGFGSMGGMRNGGGNWNGGSRGGSNAGGGN